MKKYWYKTAIMATAVGFFTACSDDNDPGIPEVPVTPTTTLGAYILNQGNWNANNGSIQWYDLETQKVSEDLFKSANGYGIGDAQHMCVYGSKIYITCTSSAKVEILSKTDHKVLKTLTLKNESGQAIGPRYLTATEGKVYFTAQNGTVSRIDTTSMSITGTLTIGDYPEALTAANGKLYINQSRYTMKERGNTVTVVDVVTFKKLKELPVLLNPYTQCITAEDGYVYFVSNGNYAGDITIPEDQWVYQTMQRIDPKTDEVKSICPATYIANKGDNMYIMYSEYYLPADTKKVSVYNLKTGVSKSLPIDITKFTNPAFLTVDPVSGDLYIGDALYSSFGEIYIYDENGTFEKKVEVGYSPGGIFFLTK